MNNTLFKNIEYETIIFLIIFAIIMFLIYKNINNNENFNHIYLPISHDIIPANINEHIGDDHETDLSDPMFCSLNCCDNYTGPEGIEYDSLLPKSIYKPYKKYVPTNISCNDGIHEPGCLCITQKQIDNVVKRTKC